MDWGTAAQWGALVIAVIAFVRGEIRVQDKDFRETMKAIDRRLELNEGRIGRLESEIVHLPGKDSVHGLEMAMQEMKGQMQVIIERVGPIKAIAERMQEVLLEGARNK